MLRTADKDQNYLSLNSDSIVWFAGTDQERQEEAGLAHPLELLPDNPKDWDSILKFSGRQTTTLLGVVTAQGREAACDINNKSSNLVLKGEWGLAGREGEWVFKIKGGSHDIQISGDVYSRGSRGDVSLGEWSDQSFEPVHDIDLSNLQHVSGRPLTVVLGRVKNPIGALLGLSKYIKIPKNGKILFWRSVGEMIYWLGKLAAVKMGMFKSK